MSKIVRTNTQTTKTTTITYSAQALCQLLGLPANTEIFVKVPGGGDWSNTDLDIDNRDRPLIARFVETAEVDNAEPSD
jgi:hypothetical protein